MQLCKHTTTIVFAWLSCVQTSVGQELVIPSNYSKEFPPLPTKNPGGRLFVEISLQLVNILAIDEVKGEMQLSCFYRVYWNDTRLPASSTKSGLEVLSDKVRTQIWRPDIVTENVRSVERNGIIKETIFNGRIPTPSSAIIFYSSYIAMRVGCIFNYAMYPMDVQACPLHIGSMGLTTVELDLSWHPTNGYKMNRLQFLRFQDLFRLKVCEDMRHSTRLSAFGHHPQKTLFFIFERNFKSSLIQVYLPSVMFVLIAWLSVLVPPTMLRTRLLLNSTNLLTIISMFISISKTESTRVPKVSYVTALNFWMFSCVAFCFSSVMLVIFDIRLVVLLTVPDHKMEFLRDFFRPKEKLHGSTALEDDDDDDDNFVDASDVTPTGSAFKLTESELRSRVAEKRLEWLARTAGFERLYLVGYPLFFVAFVAGYFIFFLWKRKHQMNQLLNNSGGANALYPGCWCLPDDNSHACMTEHDYAAMA